MRDVTHNLSIIFPIYENPRDVDPLKKIFGSENSTASTLLCVQFLKYSRLTFKSHIYEFNVNIPSFRRAMHHLVYRESEG